MIYFIDVREANSTKAGLRVLDSHRSTRNQARARPRLSATLVNELLVCRPNCGPTGKALLHHYMTL